MGYLSGARCTISTWPQLMPLPPYHLLKVKCATTTKNVGSEPICGKTTAVCDVWPLWFRTNGYLPSHRESPPFDWYQAIQLGDRGMSLNNLPKGVSWKCHRQDLNLQLLSHKSNALTRPHNHLMLHKKNLVPSVLWRCWLGGTKGIRPVKNRVVGYWRGYLSGARCRLA